MVFSSLRGVFSWLNDFLHRPLHVLIFCLGLAFISLVLEGSLFQLWSLHRNYQEIEDRIARIRVETEKLDMKIKRASEPEFLEFEARNRFNLAGKGDLIFVFSDEGSEEGG